MKFEWAFVMTYTLRASDLLVFERYLRIINKFLKGFIMDEDLAN